MSLNAMHRNTMVFGLTVERAKEQLEKLVADLDEDIVFRSDHKDCSIIKTATKKIEARKFSAYCRGYRYQNVYVDVELRIRDLDDIIAKLVPPHYYANVERDENYSWREHVHYFGGDFYGV